ncbi:MAG: hypothetical protein HDR74_05215 [Bacteroides sp.]|nr:hypothetical protein [Bacteroides sp.]
MELEFSNFIPFDSFPDGTDIDTGEQGYNSGLEKGGIYLAFAGVKSDQYFQPKRLLYIGKAEDRTNCLGKRINEHGQPQTYQRESDHARWRREQRLNPNEVIGYCYAVVDDMTNLADIEYKLIYINQPPCNSKGKENDCSSSSCPSITLKFPHEFASTQQLKGYDNTLDSWLTQIGCDK